MTRRTANVVRALLGAGILALVGGNASAAPPPSWFSYQGVAILDGVPINGNADFRISIYPTPTGGSPIGGTGQLLNVPVANGLFTLQLDLTPLPWTTFADRWLQLEVRYPAGSGSYVPLAGRQRLTAAPFSLATRGINVDVNGNLAIGSGEAGIPLTITGSSDDRFIQFNTTSNNYWRLSENGTNNLSFSFFDGGTTINDVLMLNKDGIAKVRVLQITGGSDVAEPYDVAAAGEVEPAPGMVVCIDPDHVGKMRVSTQACDRTVAGIISGANGVAPGLTLAQEGTVADGEWPIANVGRVWCLVDADANGAIEPGDLLTTSDTPGHAMKVTDPAASQGAVIGKAMSRLESGKGMVLVLVGLQ